VRGGRTGFEQPSAGCKIKKTELQTRIPVEKQWRTGGRMLVRFPRLNGGEGRTSGLTRINRRFDDGEDAPIGVSFDRMRKNSYGEKVRVGTSSERPNKKPLAQGKKYFGGPAWRDNVSERESQIHATSSLGEDS